MKRVNKFGVTLIGLFILLVAALSGCQKPAAIDRSVQVTEVTGAVAISRESPSQAFDAVSGMNLKVQDTVKTAAKSYATLSVDNDQTIDIWERVELKITELLKQADALKSTQMKLISGKIYIRIQRALNSGESFKIVTPNCILGVRGTQFFVSASGGKTEVAVLKGTVELALNKNPEKTLLLHVNQRVRIEGQPEDVGVLKVLPLSQKDLDLMVLKAIKRQPDGIAPELLKDLDNEIKKREDAGLSLLGVTVDQ